MTKEFISRKTAGSFQKTTSQFAPRPFATPQQKSAKTENSTPQDIQCLPESSNRLSRIAITQPETFTPQLTVQRAEQAQGANDNPGEEAEKIQRASTGNNRLTKISIQAPEPPSTPRFPIQAKLTVGAAGDKYEQEADRVARQVVNRIQASQINLKSSESNPVQRKISIQALGGEGGDVSSEWESQLNQARSGGQPLSPSLREPMEREFGADFSGVRVHTGAQADGLARSIQAKAFTTGQDVFFRQGAYEPGSRGGQELIAHELTHVVQQGSKGYKTGENTNKEVIRRADEDPVKADSVVTLYHVTKLINLPSIALTGLEPSRGGTGLAVMGEQIMGNAGYIQQSKGKIHVTTSWENVCQYCTMMTRRVEEACATNLGREFVWNDGEMPVVLSITTKVGSSSKYTRDRDQETSSFTTLEKIKPEDIKVIVGLTINTVDDKNELIESNVYNVSRVPIRQFVQNSLYPIAYPDEAPGDSRGPQKFNELVPDYRSRRRGSTGNSTDIY